MNTAPATAVRTPCCQRDNNGDGNCDRHPFTPEEVLRRYLNVEESRFSCDSRTGDIEAVLAIRGALDLVTSLRADRERVDLLEKFFDAASYHTNEEILCCRQWNEKFSDFRAAIDAAGCMWNEGMHGCNPE
jgi:hypothetical protein